MDKAEVGKLLTVASSIDSRTVTLPMVEAWLLSVGDISYRVARKALELHWRSSTSWLLPAHIRQLQDRAEELLAVDLERAAQQRWLGALGLTLEEYLERWEEPGWLDEQDARYQALVAGDGRMAIDEGGADV